jgi:signal transduction histidine kinase/DNA-binding response OmpR family regulator/CHASE3 domain sensor protein
MKSNFSRNLRLGFGISLVLLLASSVASYYTINKLISSAEWVDHTNNVLKVSESIISNIKDGESGQRGYLLTGQQDFLQPYNGSYERTMNDFRELKKITADNTEQQINCDSLEGLIGKRFGVLQQSIRQKDAGQEIDLFRLRDGQAYMQQARLLIKKIQRIEEGLLVTRQAELDRFIGFAPWVILTAALLALLITAFFFKRVMDDFKEKSRLADTLREKDEEISNRITVLDEVAGKIASGDYSVRLNAEQRDVLGSLSTSVNKMAVSLDHTFQQLSENEWLQTGTVQLSEKIVGDKTVEELSAEAIGFISQYTNSHVGAIYLADTFDSLLITGGYGLPPNFTAKRIRAGEGLPGQSFKSNQKIWVKDINDDIHVHYVTGELKVRQLLFYPFRHEGRMLGIIELGTINEYSEKDSKFLDKVSEILGVGITTARNRAKLKELLEETQSQSEELQAQHRELENMNAELEVQAEKLQTSEEELKVQQEELMETNQELEERSRMLEEKNHLVVVRNLEIQKKAEELALSTRYKSEFLANMSHELRTPLNSVLLLSRLLSENNLGNLNAEQIEFAQVIQSSGHGLLQLIDEILDLSKIESGKLELDYERVTVNEILQNMRMMFQPMATEKNVAMTIEADDSLPVMIETDKQRVEQVLKNLLSNALKFTHAGSIDLKVKMAAGSDNDISFIVKDSGIGIPEDKQQLIFEAFQQADGSTKRKYGGTGLGLSISRQLARLLSGDITLHSEVNKGSTFTFTIPLFKPTGEPAAAPKIPEPVAATETVASSAVSTLLAKDIPQSLPDDRDKISKDDRVLLIVEDDLNFARALLDFARKKGYKVVHIARGDEALPAAITYKPVGVLLDIQLPIKDGLTIMDELKKNTGTRHIPVHILSSFEVRKESISRGAIDFVNKPVTTDQMSSVLEKIEKAMTSGVKKVLIVEDNTYHAKALAYFLSTNKVVAEISEDIQQSVKALEKQEVNCVILDMGLPGKKAYEALDIVRQNAALENIPIIIFTGQSLSRNEEQRIRQYADTIVVKTAHSYQRILNEVSLFLHLVDQPEDKKQVRRGLGKMDEVLKNKTVLVTDDDVRNIFALTKALEKHKMTVITAIDGKEALQALEGPTKIDIVLMDMMMPEMDGYETTSRIRNNPKWKNLPVIAVTAKAMQGDRDKCIQAGASDYISKPVDTDQLLSLMRVWLYETS